MDETGTLKIPETVTKIGEGAFANVSGLKTIIIPGTVKEIGGNAFSNNKTLEKVIIEDGVEKIRESAFTECRNLEEIELPDSINYIGYQAFYSCTNLKMITIPPKVENILGYTFSGAHNLSTVILNEGLKSIGEKAFGSTSFSEITIPSTLTKIENQIFDQNSNLKNIIIKNNANFIYEDGMLITGNRENLLFISNDYLKNITTFSIPEGVKKFNTSIAAYGNIKKIVIPATLEEFIKESSNTILPITIEEIEVSEKNPKFSVSNKDKILYTKDTKELIMCFSKEENINIDPNNEIGILKLNNWSFSQIPEGVKKFNTSIAAYGNIKKIVIPATLEEFIKESSNTILPITIEEIEVSEKNPKFSVSNKDKILYTKDTKELIMCFSKEENINIDPNNEIGILKLNNWSFSQASNARVITLPDSLITIDRQVFDFNKKLQELRIGKNVSNINPIFKYLNYSGKVIIDPDNNYYTVENDILYDKSKSKLITVLYEINGEFNINNNVREIGDYAFHGQNKMTSVNIPSTLEKIGNSFMYCGFKIIDIPESVQKIGNRCFDLNPNLEKIIIHKKENSILEAPWGAIRGIKVVEWKE